MRTDRVLTRTGRLAVYAGLVVALAPSLGAQGYKVKWVCDPSKKNQRFYRRDIEVVCWEGKTYRKSDPGGIPKYMLDYFDAVRENVRRAVGEMHPSKAASRTAGPSPTVIEVSPSTKTSASEVREAPAAPPPKPLNPAVLASVEPGVPGSKLREKLGQPGSAMKIAGSDGLLEVWTYTLLDGRTAEFRIKNGALVSYQIQWQKPDP